MIVDHDNRGPDLDLHRTLIVISHPIALSDLLEMTFTDSATMHQEGGLVPLQPRLA
jgi:hypothetical protein